MNDMTMNGSLTVNEIPYRLLRLLGKGKGGYSYLAEQDGQRMVVKQIHHEPCDYYTFQPGCAKPVRISSSCKISLGIRISRLP